MRPGNSAVIVSALIRESVASARSQRAASFLTILMISGMVITVMLTTGRTVAAEQQVIGTLDSVGTRAIEIRAENDAGLQSDVLDRIRHVEGIEWAAAFSSAVDATNTAISDGPRVPVRYAYGDHFSRLGIPDIQALPGQTAYASQPALDQLGLIDIGGAITLTTGASVAVGGRIDVPDYLAHFEPVVLIPEGRTTDPQTVSVLLVIASSPEVVTPVADAVLSVLAVDDPNKVAVQTSESLAQLRGMIKSQLGSSSRALVLGLLSITALLVAGILYGLVMMRRKDFGRRRALGATRGYIVTLLMAQTALLALVGAGVGFAISLLLALVFGDPLPHPAFVGALAVLAVVSALIAALAPAIVASRREPIRELRVP